MHSDLQHLLSACPHCLRGEPCCRAYTPVLSTGRKGPHGAARGRTGHCQYDSNREGFRTAAPYAPPRVSETLACNPYRCALCCFVLGGARGCKDRLTVYTSSSHMHVNLAAGGQVAAHHSPLRT
jgi:hypothetical protein